MTAGWSVDRYASCRGDQQAGVAGVILLVPTLGHLPRRGPSRDWSGPWWWSRGMSHPSFRAWLFSPRGNHPGPVFSLPGRGVVRPEGQERLHCDLPSWSAGLDGSRPRVRVLDKEDHCFLLPVAQPLPGLASAPIRDQVGRRAGQSDCGALGPWNYQQNKWRRWVNVHTVQGLCRGFAFVIKCLLVPGWAPREQRAVSNWSWAESLSRAGQEGEGV